MKRIACALGGLVALVFTLVSCTPAAHVASGSVIGARYILRSQAGTGRALVVVLAGFGETAANIERVSGLDSYADAHGFDVVYAATASESWNAGTVCCGSDSSADVDDLATIDRIISAAVGQLPAGAADLTRVHVWGFSNGGMMAARYACNRPGKVASVGSVAGPLTSPCPFPIRMLHIHGLDDGFVPINGGVGAALDGTRGLGPFLSTYTEGSRLPAGSQWHLITHAGNHVWPAAAAEQLWRFSEAAKVA